jgi:hypothetical protein
MAEAMPYFAENLSEEGLARFWIRVTDARETGDSFFHERANREALLKLILRHPSEAWEERLRYLLEYRQVGNSAGRTLDVDAEVVRAIGTTQGNDIDRILLDIYRDAQANGRMSQSALVALGNSIKGRGVTKLP